MSQLRIEDLRAGYGHHLVLDHVNLSAKTGRWIHFKGENGTGKTTLLKSLASFHRPVGGDIFWEDRLIWNHLEAYRQQIRYLGHQHALFEELTIRDNWDLYGGLFGLDGNEDRDILPDVPLDKKVKYLSQGQMLRVELATILNSNRKLILLDEPLVSLDRSGREFVVSSLRELTREDRLVISASPDRFDGPDDVWELMNGQVRALE